MKKPTTTKQPKQFKTPIRAKIIKSKVQKKLSLPLMPKPTTSIMTIILEVENEDINSLAQQIIQMITP